MKDPIILSAIEACEKLAQFDAILDARSGSEHALDHLPGALSTPVLDDDERARVGTLYKQQSGFEAKRIGAALVARNIAALLEGPLANKPRDWAPLVYCWRGGNRSGALATVLARVGWRVSLVDGGYKAFRQIVIRDLDTLPARLDFRVLAGRTGVGKSLLLKRLAERGAQILDLEALAHHRGSVLGREPGDGRQPGQKRFETLLWEHLRVLNPARPVFVESESRRIGTCHLPEALMKAIRSGPCRIIEADTAVRAALLLAEYRHFTEQPAILLEQLNRLTELHGHHEVDAWNKQVQAGYYEALVQSLLVQHYDPAYDRSMAKNFSRLSEAPTLALRGQDASSLGQLADELLSLD